jgi:protocatechuate 3,4-dioxygenase beta subunit
MAGISAGGAGQADPSWLRSWNEAVADRPQTMSSNARIAPQDEPGVPLVLRGQVFAPGGKPADGVVVHAYHRDANGFDFGPGDDSLSTWRLQGWVRTDAQGRFEFRTIRPAPDHLGREGAHIHLTVESAEFGRQWAPTVFLSDDPIVTTDQRRQSRRAGKYGGVREVATIEGVQHVDVRIRLRAEADF